MQTLGDCDSARERHAREKLLQSLKYSCLVMRCRISLKKGWREKSADRGSQTLFTESERRYQCFEDFRVVRMRRLIFDPIL